MIVSACFQVTMASHPLLKLCRPFARRDSQTELLGMNVFLVLHVTPAQLLTVDVDIASFQSSHSRTACPSFGPPRQRFQCHVSLPAYGVRPNGAETLAHCAFQLLLDRGDGSLSLVMLACLPLKKFAKQFFP